jgi:hypothetical protein
VGAAAAEQLISAAETAHLQSLKFISTASSLKGVFAGFVSRDTTGRVGDMQVAGLYGYVRSQVRVYVCTYVCVSVHASINL